MPKLTNALERSNAFRTTNPVNGRVLKTYDFMSDAEVENVLTQAAQGYARWSSKSSRERGKILRRVGELFAERADEFAKIAATEMGKPLSQGKAEAEFSGEIFEYYAANGPDFLAVEPLEDPDGIAVLETLPVGTVLGVMPWNYPFYQVARFSAPNLIVGNTILLKHSEVTPGAAKAIEQLLNDAGVPKDAYINIRPTHKQIKRIIGHSSVQGVSLTGSERAARAVGEIAGRHRKRTVFELGGSNAHILLDTDDISREVSIAIEARMENTGQACDSNKRLIILEDMYESFLDNLVKQVEAMVPGDPQIGRNGTYAPLSSRQALQTITEQVERAVAQGATLHGGLQASPGEGYYYAPKVLTGVRPDMEAYYEEFFGPVFVVYSVRNDEEAIKLANDTRFGLGATVFSRDKERARRVASQLQVGMTVVNTPRADGVHLPFGGVKASGYGRELGKLGIGDFVNKRLFYIAQ